MLSVVFELYQIWYEIHTFVEDKCYSVQQIYVSLLFIAMIDPYSPC